MGDTSSPLLITVAREMADLTAPLCARECRAPHTCCDALYCEIARETALAHGVVLLPTTHPTLPYMGPQGCIVPPHLRPVCTIFVCCIYATGYRPGPRGKAWTARYFALRERLMTLLAKDDREQKEREGSSG